MATVARVADIAEERIFMGGLDDRSNFHNLSLQPDSWSLFGVAYVSTDYVCASVPFGWNVNRGCYHSLREANAACLQSPSFLSWDMSTAPGTENISSTFGLSDKMQWLSVAKALHVGVWASYFCGYFRLDTNGDLKPSRIQRYLGIPCDSNSTLFWVLEYKPQGLLTL